MFKPEDFVLPLEKELRLRVIDQEIRSCEDLKELQSQLIRVTKLFMTHQHLLDRCLEQLLAIEADKLLIEGLEDCDAQSQ